MFRRRELSNKLIDVFALMIKRVRKTLTVLALIGLLWSYIPWNQIDANNENEVYYSELLDFEELDELHSEIDYFNQPTTGNSFDPSNVEIEYELNEERELNTKTFRKTDGTYEIAMYHDRVHYDDDGKLKDINNRLVFNASLNAYENIANKFKVKFPKKLDDNRQIKLSMNNYSIDWNLLNIDESTIEYDDTIKTPNSIKELPNINQSILYRSIQDHVDIEYVLTGSSIKENIVLNEYVEDYSLSFEYKLKDLTIIEDEEGNLLFVNDEDEVVFNFENLVMIDSNMNHSFDINLDYVQTGNKEYQITITPDDEWLKTAVYPVKVDPTIGIYSNDNLFNDKYVREGYTSSTYTSNIAGNLSGSEYRSYLELDLTGFDDDMVITSAFIRMEATSNTCSVDCTILMKEVYEYIEFSDINSFASSITEDSVIDYEIVNSSDTPTYKWDISKNMISWMSNGESSRIIEVSMEDVSTTKHIYFKSEESSAYAGPYLEINYVSSSGLKDYWTYHSIPLGSSGTVLISDFTGDLALLRNEYTGGHTGMTINLSTMYIENMKSTNNGFGLGWTTNYNMRAYMSGVNGYSTIDASGNKVQYKQAFCSDVSEDTSLVNCKVAEDGSGNVMVYNDVEEWLYIITRNQIKYSYGASYLDSITDLKTGNKVSIYYNTDDTIEYVEDHNGNKVTYNYVNGLIDTIIVEIKNSLGVLLKVEEFEYNYDSTVMGGQVITEVIHKTDYDTLSPFTPNTDEEVISSYDYYITGELKTITTNSDSVVTFEYDNKDRVSKYYSNRNSLNLGFIEISYSNQTTTFTDHQSNRNVYSFDHYGHTVNIIDSKGNATYNNYIDVFSDGIQVGDYLTNHSIVDSSFPKKTEINPVENYGFESTTSGWSNEIDEYGGATSGEFAFGISSVAYMEGNYSGVIINPTTSSKSNFNQTVNLDAGQYVLSGYVRNNTSSSFAALGIDEVTGVVEIVGTPPTITANNQWHFVEIMFEVYQNTLVKVELQNQSSGYIYFDEIKINEGFQSKNSNLVYNSSFESNTNKWTTTTGVTHTSYDGTSSLIWDPDLKTKALSIVGEVDYLNSVQTTVDITSSTEETYYHIGSWIKGNVTPLKSSYNDDDGRLYRMKVEYVNPVSQDLVYFKIEDTITDWQYLSNKLNVPAGTTSIIITIEFQGLGDVLIDGVQLYNVPFGNEYYFDSDTGNLTKARSPITGVTDYYYENPLNGKVTSTVTDNGPTVYIDYNDDNMLESVTRNNVKSTVSYNTDNMIESVRLGNETSYFENSITYTSNKDFVASTEDEFGNTVVYDRDEVTTLLESITNEENVVESYTYDDKGRVKTVTKDNSLNEYIYVDDKLEMILVNDFAYKITYDALDRIDVVTIGYFDGGDNWQVIGDLVDNEYKTTIIDSVSYETGLMDYYTFATGNQIKFDYDEDNRVSGISYRDSIQDSYVERYQYVYSETGRLNILRDYHNSETYYYKYDIFGRMEKILDSSGNSFEYGYDSSGLLSDYSYDIENFTRAITYTRDLTTGQYDKTEYDNTVLDYSYDNSVLKRLENKTLSVSSNNINLKTYSYYEGSDVVNGTISDRLEIVTQLINSVTYSETITYTDLGYYETITDGNGYVNEFAYDNKGQLYEEKYEELEVRYRYYYDDYGNRTRKTTHSFINGQISSPTFMEYYYYDSEWEDQIDYIDYYIGMTKSYTINHSYDEQGNLLRTTDTRSSYSSRNLTFEGRELVIYGWYMGGANYKYNANGYRTQKIVSYSGSSPVTTDYVLDGSKVIFETDGTNDIYYSYDIDGSLISMNYNGLEYYYVYDVLGNVVKLLDSTGAIVEEYSYDAFGNLDSSITLSTIGSKNPYRYKGYRFDEETGLYYLNSRYYNPETGRFISTDGIIDTGGVLGKNMYAYTYNNPLMYSDINGYMPVALREVGGQDTLFPQMSSGMGSTSLCGDCELVVDVSVTILFVQVGASFVIDFEDQYVEMYPHVGICIGCTVNIDLGLVDNYENPGDYRGHFLSSSGSYVLGGGHSFTPDFSDFPSWDIYDEDQARATYITISPPGFSAGYSYYYWEEDNQIIYYWGDE